MTKNEMIRKLEALKDKPMQYGEKLWKLKNYSVDEVQERVYMHTHQGKQYDRPFDGFSDFLEQLTELKEGQDKPTPIYSMKELTKKPSPSDVVKTDIGAPQTLQDLRDILMNNIENLRTGKIDVLVAREICGHAQAIVNITKLQLEYFRTR